MDALVVGCAEVPASVDATFSWYFRDEDRWLTVESQATKVSVRPGLTEDAEMKFYSACVADFIHQHTTEGAGRAIHQGGGFYWRGDISRLKEIAPLCKVLFGPRLHQKLVSAGITVPKFEVRRYPARTKAQRDRILAEWQEKGEQAVHASSQRNVSTPQMSRAPMSSVEVPAPRARVASAMANGVGSPEARVVQRAAKAARAVKAAKTVAATKVTRTTKSKPATKVGARKA